MKRLRDTFTIMEFALRAILLLWQEPKTAVTWKREGKRLCLLVDIYNHLFNDEIEGGQDL
jgi:hypothetical protein